MTVRRRAVVTGRVQGVWYRDSCREMAHRLGVNGWVRNREDGAVEILAEGEAHAVEALLAWAREGPPRALVAGVRVSDEPPTGEQGFRITR